MQNEFDKLVDKIETSYEEEKAIDEEEQKEEFLQAIFDINEIIDLLRNHKIDSLKSIKGSLLNIDVILNYFQKHYSQLDSFLEFKAYLTKEHQVILDLIESNASHEEVLIELQSLLERVNNYYRNALKTDSDMNKPANSLKNEEYSEDYNQVDLDIEPLVIPELDKLYKKLYDAIAIGDVKKETVYRGRIIRKLKDYRTLIDDKYEQIVVLTDIKYLISTGGENSFDEIKELLKEEKNKNYLNYFSKFLNSYDMFLQLFNELYQRSDIVKIMYYHDSLKHELDKHGKKLKERYSKEFLDKKTSVKSVVTTLPKAVGLSIQKLANTITEFKEARSTRKRLSKFLESLKDVGRVIATPAVFIGKFAISNWYALYRVYKGVTDAKTIQEKQNAPKEIKEDKESQTPKDESEKVTSDTNTDEKNEEVKTDEDPRFEVEKPGRVTIPRAEEVTDAHTGVHSTPVEYNEDPRLEVEKPGHVTIPRAEEVTDAHTGGYPTPIEYDEEQVAVVEEPVTDQYTEVDKVVDSHTGTAVKAETKVPVGVLRAEEIDASHVSAPKSEQAPTCVTAMEGEPIPHTTSITSQESDSSGISFSGDNSFVDPNTFAFNRPYGHGGIGWDDIVSAIGSIFGR